MQQRLWDSGEGEKNERKGWRGEGKGRKIGEREKRNGCLREKEAVTKGNIMSSAEIEKERESRQILDFCSREIIYGIYDVLIR